MNSNTQNLEKYNYPFQNPHLSIDERVNDLVSRLTLEEKINQMKYDSPPVNRLSIPEYNWWNECLHGVARAGLATVFPQAINLASTWDTNLIFRIATAISDEARAKYNYFSKKGKTLIYQGLTFWSPNINIFRDPRWGRGHETYGEDPYLTGEIGLNFVKGLQGNDTKYFKVIATPKHFAVHSGPESNRHIFDAKVSERDLRETYLPAFRRCIVDGKAYSIMCAYNRFMGNPCCGSEKLLKKILRDEWKFPGYVVSDCGAIEDFYFHHKVSNSMEEAVALAVKSGTDLNCGDCYPKLINAIKQNLITEEEIDVSVKRLFKARFLLGMFDPPEMVPFNKIQFDTIHCKKHEDLALEAAKKSIVLLKNDGILPLSKSIKRIALIGPNANDIDVLLGNYNGTPFNPITLYKGLKNKLGKNTEIIYSQGCNIADGILQYEIIPEYYLFTNNGDTGLEAEYFNNTDLQGEILLKRVDKEINFNWWNKAPDSMLLPDKFSVRWSGFIIPKESGNYHFLIRDDNKIKLYINDKLVLSSDGDKKEYVTYFEAEKKYKIKYELLKYTEDSYVQLLWSYEDNKMLEKAVENAKQSDIVIVALGTNPRIEGEEMDVSIDGFIKGDRTNIELPKTQLDLLEVLYQTGKPIVLVLFNGGAIGLESVEKKLNSIVQVGYPGEKGGVAIADVLFGDYNPAGRLPVTYYKSTQQLPSFEDYTMKGRTYRYFNGEPLYPFGFGLSYTKFIYSNLRFSKDKIKTNETFEVSVEVQNVGIYPGDEVVQLYISDLDSKYERPIRSLQGFQRVHLLPNEKKKIIFTISPRQLSIIDDENERIVEPGIFEISVGGKQPGFKGPGDSYTTDVLTSKLKIEGDIFLIEEYEN